eukprot:6191400-Pleurochrysis_carterae.AAC.3
MVVYQKLAFLRHTALIFGVELPPTTNSILIEHGCVTHNQLPCDTSDYITIKKQPSSNSTTSRVASFAWQGDLP